jgi:hypothetical protein
MLRRRFPDIGRRAELPPPWCEEEA